MEPESLGTKELHKLCSTRIREIEEAIAESERKHREKIGAAKVELSKLRRIVAFCEGGDSRSTRVARESKNGWTCPDCGHRTVSRWVRRHREQECPARPRDSAA